MEFGIVCKIKKNYTEKLIRSNMHRKGKLQGIFQLIILHVIEAFYTSKWQDLH